MAFSKRSINRFDPPENIVFLPEMTSFPDFTFILFKEITMRRLVLTWFWVLVLTTPALADCAKEDICKMMKTMGHFDILNQCPQAGPLLAECKKVSVKDLVNLEEPQFVDNNDGTITDTVNKLVWLKKGILTKSSLKTANDLAMSSNDADQSGWRIPSLPELKTLLHDGRVKNASGQKAWIHPLFDDGRGFYYWTSTTCEEVSVITDRYQKKLCQQGAEGAWLIHFNIGAIFWHHVTTENYFVRLVKNAE